MDNFLSTPRRPLALSPIGNFRESLVSSISNYRHPCLGFRGHVIKTRCELRFVLLYRGTQHIFYPFVYFLFLFLAEEKLDGTCLRNLVGGKRGVANDVREGLGARLMVLHKAGREGIVVRRGSSLHPSHINSTRGASGLPRSLPRTLTTACSSALLKEPQKRSIFFTITSLPGGSIGPRMNAALDGWVVCWCAPDSQGLRNIDHSQASVLPFNFPAGYTYLRRKRIEFKLASLNYIEQT